LLLLGIISATSAFAEDRAFTVQANQQLLRHERSRQGDATSSATSTMPNSLELVLNVAAWHLHVFPTDDAAPLQLGFDVLDGLELGVSAALDDATTAGGHDRSESRDVGIFAVQAFAVRSAALELGLAAGSSRRDDKTTDAATGDVTRSKAADRYATLGVGLVVPVVNGLAWLATTSFESRFDNDDDDDTTTATVSPLGVRIEL
jgi:hypothetical protein